MAAGGAHEMDKLVQGDKYIMQEIQLSDYAVLMNLTIRGLAKHDFGGYVCSSVNVLGKSEGNIRLQGAYIYSCSQCTRKRSAGVKNLFRCCRAAPAGHAVHHDDHHAAAALARAGQAPQPQQEHQRQQQDAGAQQGHAGQAAGPQEGAAAGRRRVLVHGAARRRGRGHGHGDALGPVHQVAAAAPGPLERPARLLCARTGPGRRPAGPARPGPRRCPRGLALRGLRWGLLSIPANGLAAHRPCPWPTRLTTAKTLPVRRVRQDGVVDERCSNRPSKTDADRRSWPKDLCRCRTPQNITNSWRGRCCLERALFPKTLTSKPQ